MKQRNHHVLIDLRTNDQQTVSSSETTPPAIVAYQYHYRQPGLYGDMPDPTDFTWRDEDRPHPPRSSGSCLPLHMFANEAGGELPTYATTQSLSLSLPTRHGESIPALRCPTRPTQLDTPTNAQPPRTSGIPSRGTLGPARMISATSPNHTARHQPGRFRYHIYYLSSTRPASLPMINQPLLRTFILHYTQPPALYRSTAPRLCSRCT